MLRSILLVAIVACLGCKQQIVEHRDIDAGTNDVAEIYGAFLDEWTGKEKDPINVSIVAKAPSAEEIKQFSECAADTRWMEAKSINDIAIFVGRLPYVRLVDSDKWSPQDPSVLIAEGQSVESAVEAGFAHGLLTLSAISFDESHTTAAFTYSFVCGALCGSGGPAIFKATPDGWVQSDKQCGGWVSYLQRSRPGNSFEPTPLRGLV